MLLNIHIIYDELKNITKQIMASDNKQRNLEGVRLFTDRNESDNKYIYVLDSSMIHEAICIENFNYFVICHCPLSDMLLDGNLDLHQAIFIKENISYIKVFNMIQSIFEKYNSWETQIFYAIFHKMPIHDFFNLSAAVLKNPIALVDNSFNFLMYSGNFSKNIKGSIWEQAINDGFIRLDLYTIKEQKAVFKELEDNGFFYNRPNDRYSEYTNLVIRLSIENKSIAILASNDINVPFTLGQFTLVMIVKEFMEMFLKNNKLYERITNGLNYYFKKLLQKSSVDDDVISFHLNNMKWKINDKYGLLYFRSRDNICIEEELKEVYTTQIKNLIEDAYVMSYDNGIITLIHNYNENKKFLTVEFQSFLQRTNLICGISFAFSNFSNVYFAYIQSQAALSEDCITAKEYVYFYQTNYVQHIMRSLAASGDLKAFCHPKILEFYESSKKRSVDLIQTLYFYIINGCNSSAAAKALHIHRNTLLYRLELIQKFLDTEINPEDYNTNFEYLISCSIISILSE